MMINRKLRLLTALSLLLAGFHSEPAWTQSTVQSPTYNQYAMAKRRNDSSGILRWGSAYLKEAARKRRFDALYVRVGMDVANAGRQSQQFDIAIKAGKSAYDYSRRIRGIDLQLQAMAAAEYAMCLENTGKYKEAERIFKSALLKLKNKESKYPAALYRLYTGFAILYEDMRDYDQAEQVLTKAKDILVKYLNSPRNEMIFMNYKFAYQKYMRGDYVGADASINQGLAMVPSGTRSGNLLVMLLNLKGRIYKQTHDLDKSLKTLITALGAAVNTYGKNHPQTIGQLSSLAGVYSEMGDWAKSLEYLKIADQHHVKSLGPDYRGRKTLENNMGYAYLNLNQIDQAEKLMQGCVNWFKKEVGASDPLYANALNTLAMIKVHQKNELMAIKYLEEVHQRYTTLIQNTIGIGTEDQKLAFIRKLEGKTNYALWFGIEASQNERARDIAINTAIQRKGLIADLMSLSLELLQRNSNYKVRKQLGDLIEIRRKLSETSFGRGSSAETAALQRKADAIEKSLKLNGTGFKRLNLKANVRHLQRDIPIDAAYIEFIEYRPYVNGIPKSRRHEIKTRYAACVITRHSISPWHQIGDTENINREIAAMHVAILNMDPKVKTIAQSLYQKLLSPLESHFSEKKTLLISPDGVLNLLPFAALKKAENTYLFHDHSLCLVNNARDISGDIDSHSTSRQVVGFGNPDYNARKSGASTRPSRPSLKLAALPGTAREMALLKELIPDAKTHDGLQATEGLLKKVKSPRILHLATHGYFQPDPPYQLISVTMPDGRKVTFIKPRKAENPMTRAGVTFTGANHMSYGDEDGLLSAMEASHLNLRGTELVILSACQTGLGDILPGEGVYGLRRAFQIAGAKTTMITLWPIADDSTVIFMRYFYESFGVPPKLVPLIIRVRCLLSSRL